VSGPWQMDKVDYVHEVLEANLPRHLRMVLVACTALSDFQGFVKLNLSLIAPAAGYRRRYASQAIDELVALEWITHLNHQADAKLTYGKPFKGPLMVPETDDSSPP
jgi:hypothetical protein